jgi:hypothetical protein
MGAGMTDEKICPFMSRGFIAFVDDIGDCETGLHHIYCQKENCMAWGSKILYTETNTGAVVKSDGCRLIP